MAIVQRSLCEVLPVTDHSTFVLSAGPKQWALLGMIIQMDRIGTAPPVCDALDQDGFCSKCYQARLLFKQVATYFRLDEDNLFQSEELIWNDIPCEMSHTPNSETIEALEDAERLAATRRRRPKG